MVDPFPRSMTPSSSQARAGSWPGVASRHALVAIGSAWLLWAAPVVAADLTTETRTATGARGDAIVHKGTADGPAPERKTASPPTRDGHDPLRGLMRDPTREAAGTPAETYVDAAGNLRALPGGVIVVFADAIAPDAARQVIANHGQAVERQLAPGVWLVRTGPGDAAIEVSRALAASGDFRSVEPNWWRPPVRK